MSDFTAKDMTGVLFKNPYKEEGDTKPNVTGHGTIDGRKIKISAWTKDGQKGKFQSLAFTWVDEAAPPKPQNASKYNNDPWNE
jgi:hypothetical protein